MSWISARNLARILLLLLSAGLTACGGDPASPQERLRAVVDAMQSAVEQGSVQDVSALLHRDYRDRAHANRRQAVATLFGYLRRHRQIHLFSLVRSIDVAEDGQSARAEVLVAMGGVPLESLETVISLRADLYRFDVGFRRHDGDWQVSDSDWQRVRAQDFMP